MAELLENETLRDRTHVFADRNDAGRQLAEVLRTITGTDSLVLAIPSGGVPVGFEIAAALGLDFDLMLVRKVQIPWNTEAGFAAINMDADLFVNEHLLALLNLSEDQIESQVNKALATIEQRNVKFRQNRPFPEVAGRAIILADDGLASGYTMKAAVSYLRRRKPVSITVAVPTGSAETVKMLLREVDTLCCLNVRGGYPYAVASAYRDWHDLDDDEVIRILGNA